MEKIKNTKFRPGINMMIEFIVYTILIKTIDVKAIGPNNSSVGFAAINKAVANKIPYNEFWYQLTQIIGYLAIAVCVVFGFVGLVQWIKRKNILKVDIRIISQGVFYIIVMSFYALFEVLVINLRPIIQDGELEASYPSSHTVLLVCVMLTAILQIGWLIKNKNLKIALDVICLLLCALMIVGRIISGVHWITDIVGGLLLSASLVTLYYSYFKSIK